ncbi:proton pump-interactor 1-like isoform X2 [Phoenix dactylifera]|nr:proton pump-interactor 1-like isoform X2 [Phoenix dactylifera]XP_038986287.1 proton pump-interactor 1-like isoform X2 [Phoenix dactylifera]XP_038986289.1 proton pump-interactor 1-like isoform X2 [Phoenix dactylifera]
MVVETVGADITPSQVKEGIEGDNTFLAEMDSKTKSNQGHGLDGLSKFGSVDDSHGVNGEGKEGDRVANVNFPKDAVDEWPAPKQFHTFYFVKHRSYEDPKLKAKIEQADKEIRKKNEHRFQITEALKAKRSERAQVISQLKPLTAEDKQYRMIMDEKRKEMKPFHEALGKLRSANNDVREKGMGLCSSEEELNELIESRHYHMQHESLTLVEEKQLIKEIKQLEGTREKVIANAAMRAKIQDSLGQREAIQDQVKLQGGDIDGFKKEQQAVRMKIRQLEEELKTIDDEIISLQEELTAVNEKKDKAFETLIELRKARDVANACYFQNRSLLNTAKDLAAKKDIAALQELAHAEEEKFMSQWRSNKDFRDDYEKRILPSLDLRQLSRDGRIRNPDERPIISEAPSSTGSETMPAKASVKQAKEGVNPAPLNDTVTSHKLHDAGNTKSTEVASKRKMSGPMDTENASVTEMSQKESSKVEEIDTVKLKEMKREEEIAKAKMASERKKRQAEKAAAKAAIRAQKEAEKKLKEKEKRARKKAGTSAPAALDEQTEMDMKIVEPEDTNVNIEAPISKPNKEQKGKARYRNHPKGRAPLPRVILKRQKSHSYWLWAAPAIVGALVLVLLTYYFSFGRN